MNELTTITTARVSVAGSTQAANPYKLNLNVQNKILTALKIVFAIASNTVGQHATSGYRIYNGGRLILPGFGSVDEVTNQPYCGVPSFGEFLNFENLYIPLDGTPYELNFEFYNSGALAVQYYIYAITSPQIELPPAPIVADQKKND